MRFMDCTLRDGSNVLGKGFPADLTTLMLRGLIENNIRTIEYGNAGGIGAYALGKRDRAVPPARTSDGDDERGLALLDVPRDEEGEKLLDAL